MTRSPVRNVGTFALLLVLALAFMLMAAGPAWADHDQGSGHGHSGDGDGDGDDDDDDDDDDDSPATTSTTSAPTPTTTQAPTTETLPPTPTTVPVRATTTTSSTTATTNIPPPPRDLWEEQRPESASTTTTTRPSRTQDDFDANGTLVLSLALTGPGDSGGGSTGSDENGFHISPREGLTVAFRTAVEVIQDQVLPSILLGLLVAAFFMAGVDKRRAQPKPEAGPLRRPYSTGRRTRSPGTSPQL